jgi:DNA primase
MLKVDLTSSKSRQTFIKEARELYSDAFEDELGLRRALSDVALYFKDQEQIAKSKAEENTEDDDSPGAPDAPEVGSERYEAAMELLQDSRLLARAAVDMKRLGHVGEGRNKQLALVCAVSARAGVPIQPSTHAQSSAGKNALWDMVLSLFPEEKVVRRSGMTAKALFRTSVDLRGAVLYIQEVAGSEDADFSIRILQSDGRLEYEATEKMPDGSMQSVVHTTEGPTVVVQTTTKNHLHPENETRVLPIYIDESEEQTERITRSILRCAAGEAPDDEESTRLRQRWHDAIRLLEQQDVVITYAKRIRIPRTPLRVRRDANRLMDVIRVVAWLYQHQRARDARGRIVAEESDFHTAMRLVSGSLNQAWQSLTPSESKMLDAIRKLNPHLRDKGFKRRDLNVRGISDPQQKRALASLESSGYLECDHRQGPQGFTYTLARDSSEVPLGISLEPITNDPMIRYEESPANRAKKADPKPMIRYKPIIESDELDTPSGSSAHSGSSGNGPIEAADLQEKLSIGSSDHDDSDLNDEPIESKDVPETSKGETSLGTYEHNA